MHIEIEHKDGKYTSFNIGLCSKEGAEPFLVVKGCRIANGKNGQFVSGPSTKNGEGKYWNHTYMNDAFSAEVLKRALATMPKAAPSRPGRAEDDDSTIPF